jgi:hypothetical protein
MTPLILFLHLIALAVSMGFMLVFAAFAHLEFEDYLKYVMVRDLFMGIASTCFSFASACVFVATVMGALGVL